MRIEDLEPLPGETWDQLKARHRELTRGTITGTPAVKVRRSLQGADGIGSDYREDLARFPGDPEAFVTGPTSLRRLIDKRKRQGWRQREETWDDLERKVSSTTVPGGDLDGEKLVMDAYNEALAEVAEDN